MQPNVTRSPDPWRPMTIPYLQIVVLGVFAVVFYQAGKIERSWAVLWATLSIAASILALRFLSWGLGGVILAQVVLFAGITFWRMRKD
jgi:hypothetical protein